jgi:hypothetical protein
MFHQFDFSQFPHRFHLHYLPHWSISRNYLLSVPLILMALSKQYLVTSVLPVFIPLVSSLPQLLSKLLSLVLLSILLLLIHLQCAWLHLPISS